MKQMISILILAGLALSFGISAFAEPLLGGWQTPDSPELTPEAQAAFDKAMEGLVGVSYVPVALLGTQVVSGQNYSILCEAKVVYPGAEPYYAKVTIYEDLQGNVSITDIEKVETHTVSEQAAFASSPSPDPVPESAPVQQESSFRQKLIDSVQGFFRWRK